MKIEFIKKFRSVKSGTCLEAGSFMILTGKNGSGKSNILKAIGERNNVLIDGTPANEFSIRLFQHDSFSTTRFEKEYKGGYGNESPLNKLWKQHQFGPPYDSNSLPFLEDIAIYHNKEVDALTRSDFKSYPIDRKQENLDLFGYTFFKDTMTYLDLIEADRYNAFRNVEYGEENIVYSQKEFEEKFNTPPWERMNNILDEVGLNYRFNAPKKLNRVHSLDGELIDIVNNFPVMLGDMSPGERTIISLVTLIYNSRLGIDIPDVFLFDEPDALLHPEFSRILVRTLDEYIVKELGKKVIITTHSPSTVAIAPDDSIFICEKKSFNIRLATKDKALAHLTQNLHSLSVLHENRKQIFVEDRIDAMYYETISKYAHKHLIPEISLDFIPISTTGTGGCAKVKSVTKDLVNHGNKSVGGIIDWDENNTTSPPIYVSGENKRYSLENYLFDPILIFALLLQRRIPLTDKLQHSSTISSTRLAQLENDTLQEIVDEVVDQSKALNTLMDNSQNVNVKYLNGREVKIPSWFLIVKGHDLEKFVIERYPKLKEITSKKKLGIYMIESIIGDFPGFIPVEIVTMLKAIQIGK